jgi:hypothetical protein
MGSTGLASLFAATGERHSTMAKTLKSLGGGPAIEAGKVTTAMATARATWVRARRRRLRASGVPEEFEEGNRDIKARNGSERKNA